MLLPKRVWKDIRGYEGLYQVSNLGEIKSLNYARTKRSKVMSPGTDRNGYKFIYLWKFSCQGLNLSHSCNLCHSYSNTGSLTPLCRAGA